MLQYRAEEMNLVERTIKQAETLVRVKELMILEQKLMKREEIQEP